MTENLKIKQKVEDTLQYLYIALKHFPKSERFTLCADIKQSTYKVIRLIIQANKTKNKLPILYEIDTELDMLRMMIRLSMKLEFMPFKKYEVIINYLSEVGKMLGGWIKSAK